MPAATATDARKLLDAKLGIPGEMRTAEWAMLPQWLRERTFYMAGVHQAEILDEFRGEVAKIAQGETSIPQAEKRLGKFLDAAGYRPAPGQEGTIKDLRSWRRMRVALRTNVELLQGWGQKESGLRAGAAAAFPAWELVRYAPRAVPRDWPARFTLSGGEIRGGRMIALKDSPVWAELGNFEDGIGVDYPPFAWGSGMGWRAVGFREARELGLIPPGWRPPAPRPVSSPNEALETTPRVSEPALREELARRMRGLAEWQGDKFVFTDPNGSRRMDAEKLAGVWALGMDPLFHRERAGTGNDEGLVQRLALQLWSENHDQFTRKIDPDTGEDTEPPPGRLDLFDDLVRLFDRLTPMPGNQPVYRGMAWDSRDGLDDFLTGMRKSRVYMPLSTKPADSWSVAASGARKYQSAGRFSVRLVCGNHHSAKDISALLRLIKDITRNPDPKHPLVTDGEVVFANGAKFKLLRIERGNITEKGGEATVYVQQL